MLLQRIFHFYKEKKNTSNAQCQIYLQTSCLSHCKWPQDSETVVYILSQYFRLFPCCEMTTWNFKAMSQSNEKKEKEARCHTLVVISIPTQSTRLCSPRSRYRRNLFDEGREPGRLINVPFRSICGKVAIGCAK